MAHVTLPLSTKSLLLVYEKIQTQLRSPVFIIYNQRYPVVTLK